LSFQEHRTARLVAETLEGFGIETQTGVGRTGVVGIPAPCTPAATTPIPPCCWASPGG
jgi:metal-dependent amidase/aminoacylase/carboxypeptidase family protein